jgi:hypothetical protein
VRACVCAGGGGLSWHGGPKEVWQTMRVCLSVCVCACVCAAGGGLLWHGGN